MSVTLTQPPILTTASTPSVALMTVDPQFTFVTSIKSTASSVINSPEAQKTAQLELVGKSTPPSDAPETQAMQEEGCCKDCGDCLRAVCTIDCCCKCCALTCDVICCIFDIVVGAREVQRGRERGDVGRVFMGTQAMAGNQTAVALSLWDQRK